MGYIDFDVLGSLDDRTIQKILREIDTLGDLPMALKLAKKDVFSAVLRNMSKRAALMLIEQMEYMSPILLRYAQEAQKRIIEVIRYLEDTGEISIPEDQ